MAYPDGAVNRPVVNVVFSTAMGAVPAVAEASGGHDPLPHSSSSQIVKRVPCISNITWCFMRSSSESFA